MIKEILSIVNLPHVLNFIKPFLTHNHLEYIKTSINKFILCRDTKAGFIKYTCTECGHYHTIPITCKSRLCPSCGFKYSATWTQKMTNDILNVPHRHILFTIPEELRPFFFYDRNLLSKLATAVNETMEYQFHNIYKKNNRKNKLPKSSPDYFTNSDIVHYGLITVIHTFGRDLKWNPHIHALVSLGGFTKNFTFKKLDYFHVPSIAGQWKYHVLDIVKNGNYPNPKIKNLALKTVSKLYKENKRFFFNVGSGNVNSPKGIVKYLGRYLARAPIAEYKIINYDNKKVTFFFNDLADNKKKKYVTMDIDKFVQQVLIHLPPKNFKMINRFGFYGRNISTKLKDTIKKYKKRSSKSEYSFFVKQSIETFDIHPFMCPHCKIMMEKQEIYVSANWYGRTIHKIYF